MSPKLIAVGAAIGTAGGFAGGYIYAKKKLESQMDLIIEEEIVQTKEFYARLNEKPQTPQEMAARYKDETNKEPDEISEEAIQAFRKYIEQGEPAPGEILINGKTADERAQEQLEGEPVEEVTSVSIFESSDLESISQVDLDARNSNEPYIITAEEFNHNENEYETATLTYFEGDDIVADIQDDPVPEPDKILGENNYKKFGYGSNDRNLVYIQNDNLEVLFEVVRSTGKFAHEVLGGDFDDETELRHSHRRPGVMKFRGYED